MLPAIGGMTDMLHYTMFLPPIEMNLMNFSLDWLQTVVLPMSASQVNTIRGMSQQQYPASCIFYNILYNKN
jgi:hypothetical protein